MEGGGWRVESGEWRVQSAECRVQSAECGVRKTEHEANKAPSTLHPPPSTPPPSTLHPPPSLPPSPSTGIQNERSSRHPTAGPPARDQPPQDPRAPLGEGCARSVGTQDAHAAGGDVHCRGRFRRGHDRRHPADSAPTADLQLHGHQPSRGDHRHDAVRRGAAQGGRAHARDRGSRRTIQPAHARQPGVQANGAI